MQLGIGSYTFPWSIGVPGHPPASPLTPLQLVDRAGQLGVRVVQFCDNLPLEQLPPTTMEALVARARELSLRVELGARGISDPARLLAQLELATRFQSPFLRLVVDAAGHEPSPAECIDRLRPLVPRFADAGVRIALENHDRFPCAVLGSIVEELGPEHIGVCLDTVNSFGALEGPEVVVRTLAPYTLNLHVKDFTITRVSSQMGFVVQGCPAGEGRLDLPWLLNQLRTAGRDPNAILELWTPFGPTVEATVTRETAWAESSVRRLRQFIPD